MPCARVVWWDQPARRVWDQRQLSDRRPGSELRCPGEVMAFPTLRHALVAVAVLRRVAAHDPSKCYEWGSPKEGKWQHDEDCCAGEDQAACAAGYRYDNGEKGEECGNAKQAKGKEKSYSTCNRYKYTCTKCDGAD